MIEKTETGKSEVKQAKKKIGGERDERKGGKREKRVERGEERV